MHRARRGFGRGSVLSSRTFGTYAYSWRECLNFQAGARRKTSPFVDTSRVTRAGLGTLPWPLNTQAIAMVVQGAKPGPGRVRGHFYRRVVYDRGSGWKPGGIREAEAAATEKDGAEPSPGGAVLRARFLRCGVAAAKNEDVGNFVLVDERPAGDHFQVGRERGVGRDENRADVVLGE